MASSLEITDQASAAVATEPRVSLADIKAAISRTYYMTGLEATNCENVSPEHLKPLSVMTMCVMVMRNGFMVIGKSAPASAGNYDRDLGKQYAYEDAIRQLWPLMGFSLRDRLYELEASRDAAD